MCGPVQLDHASHGIGYQHIQLCDNLIFKTNSIVTSASDAHPVSIQHHDYDKEHNA